MFELMDGYSQTAVIKVLGIGGGGGNAVAHMVRSGIEGVDFICANTDSQALKGAKVKTGLQIGCNITKGLGAGANPEVGRQAAMEDRDRIQEVIEGADMLFLTAGLGGGTGTGAAPVVAQLAKEMGILTVAVVTKPFGMEGPKRMRVAEQGIAELGRFVDSLITIPNEKLLSVLGPSTTLLDAFRADRSRGRRIEPAARGHQSRGRERSARERHCRARSLDRRVPGGRRYGEAVRVGRCHRRHRHRHRSRHER
jgi:cell division protein FtsZ